MIDAGALGYYSTAKDLAHIARVYEQDDWYLIDERANRFRGLLNDEYGNHAIAELVGFVSLSRNRAVSITWPSTQTRAAKCGARFRTPSCPTRSGRRRWGRGELPA